MLWYQGRQRPVDDTRKFVAASVAYHLSKCYTSFAGPRFGAGTDLSRVLYYQWNTEQHLQPEKIICSFICQSLLMDCINVVSLDRHLLQLHPQKRAFLWHFLEEKPWTSAEPRLHVLSELIDILRETLLLIETPQALAIDNLHLVDPTRVDIMIKCLVSILRADRKLPIIVSGIKSEAMDEILRDFLPVDDDTERQGMLFSPFN